MTLRRMETNAGDGNTMTSSRASCCFRRLSRVHVRKATSAVALMTFGMMCGVVVNYYGLVFESIRVHVEVSSADVANTSSVLSSLGLPAEQFNNLSSLYVVPNIVHFVWFASDSNRQLSFLNYISILSAHRIQKPDAILFHCNHLPAGEWWQRLWREVPLKIIHREPPATIHEQRIIHVYHRGDIAKIEILLEYGGIYLDYDVIVVNSLDPVRRFDATLGKEKPPKFIAGIIIARKGSTFLRLLYESYRNNYRPWDWDYNCARVAYQLYLQRPDLLHVEPYKFTTPDWKDRHLLWNQVIDWRQLYVIHVMSHFTWEEHSPETIKRLNSTFGEAMRYIYYGSSKIVDT